MKKMVKYSCYFIFVLVIFLVTVISCKNSDSPEASFDASIETTQVGDSISFTNTSSNAEYYQWSFGDGTYAISKDAKHAYTSSGIYTVTMTAIGSDKASSCSKSIIITGEVTIYPGTGISEVSVYDNWSTINNKYADEDTAHYVDYSDPYYYHTVYYYNLGIGVFFVNSNESQIDDSDEAYMVFVYSPYAGFTEKGIQVGSLVSEMETAYGTPGLYTGSDYYVYYYDDLGIEFYTSKASASAANYLIAVYEGSAKKSGKVDAQKMAELIFQRQALKIPLKSK